MHSQIADSMHIENNYVVPHCIEMQNVRSSHGEGRSSRSFSQPNFYKTAVVTKRIGASWRTHGRLFREKLLSEDEHDGGLTFNLSQQVNIERYFALAERILNQFTSNWLQNQYHMIDTEERSQLLDLYKQGNRLTKFFTKVLPTHREYFSEEPVLKALRQESQEQVVTLLDYLEDVAITIDQHEFNNHVIRNDRGPSLSSYFDAVAGSDDDPSVQMSQIDEEGFDPSEQGDPFLGSTGSHISLLETEEPAKTPSCLEGVPKQPKKVTPSRTPRRKTKGSHPEEHKRASPPSQLCNNDEGVNFLTPSPRIKHQSYSSKKKHVYFLTSNTPVHNTPKSVADLSDWFSGDDTVSTVLSGDLGSSGHSSTSAHVSYYQLATEKICPTQVADTSDGNDPDEGPGNTKDEYVSLTKQSVVKGVRQRQRKSNSFKGCVRCLIE